jgi:uncharacterized protein VirK/YbjX
MRLLNNLLSANLIQLAQRHPRLTIKYLGGNYLARCLSTKARLAILSHHYEFLRHSMKRGFAAQLCDVRPVLWQIASSDAQFEIRMSFPYSLHHPDRTVDHEGDLALTMYMDSVPLYVMCMTIAPAGVAGITVPECGGAHTLFVGRIQGADGRFEQIRHATKMLHDISPRDVLFAAAQGIAGAIGAKVVVGVSTEEQLFRPDAGDAADAFFDYSKFWEMLGARRTADNLFALTLPLQEKPIEMIAQKHKSRTLRKRAFKKQLCAEVCEQFGTRFMADFKTDPQRLRSMQMAPDTRATA